MNPYRRCRRYWTLPLALLLVAAVSPAAQVRAGAVSGEGVIEVAAADEVRQRVEDFVGREDVREQLEALGVDPEEAAARLEGLSDAEVRQIASYVEEEPASLGAVAILPGAILFILVVLVITDLLGVTRVFPFVRSQR